MVMKHLRWKLLCLFAMVLSGCATVMHDFGKIVPDNRVTKDFEMYQMDPDMNYYFSGSEAYPNAIIGLKKKYVLDNDLWKPIKPDPQTFTRMVSDMQYLARYIRLQGFIMESPSREAIGVWYSRIEVKMIVRMGTVNKIVVFTPDMKTYR
jgi:hypothetical protein